MASGTDNPGNADERLSRLEAELNSIREEMNCLRGLYESMRDDIERMGSSIEGLEERVGELERGYLGEVKVTPRYIEALRDLYIEEPKTVEEKVIDITARLLAGEWKQADVRDLRLPWLITADFAPKVEGWDLIADAIGYLYRRELSFTKEQIETLERMVQYAKCVPELKKHEQAYKKIVTTLRRQYFKPGLSERVRGQGYL